MAAKQKINLKWFFSALLDLPNYCSDSWRRYNLKGVHWCINGDVES